MLLLCGYPVFQETSVIEKVVKITVPNLILVAVHVYGLTPLNKKKNANSSKATYGFCQYMTTFQVSGPLPTSVTLQMLGRH